MRESEDATLIASIAELNSLHPPISVILGLDPRMTGRVISSW
jgi:hypothetical protein